MIILILTIVCADYLTFVDFDNEKYYSWVSLQKENPYVLSLDNSDIIFNYGTYIDECGGEGSAVVMLKDGECSVIGIHENTEVKSYTRGKEKGITISYTGEKCLFSNHPAKFTTKLICGETESEFENILGSLCDINIQKTSKIGCGTPYGSEWLYYSILFAVLLIILSILLVIIDSNSDDLNTVPSTIPVWREMKTVIRKGKKLIFKNNTYNNV